MMRKRTSKPPTPLEELRAARARARERCRSRAARLDEGLRFARRHAGELLFAGVAALFLPGKGGDAPGGDAGGRGAPGTGAPLEALSPVVAEVLAPAVARWAAGWIGRLLGKRG